MTSFTLIGTVDGHTASVTWTDGELAPGSDRIVAARALALAHSGETVDQTPTGPTYRASLKTPAAAYVTIAAGFDQRYPVEASGDVPELPGTEIPPGTVS